MVGFGVVIGLCNLQTAYSYVKQLQRIFKAVVFSPLDLRSNGLMVSCFVRRAPCAVHVISQKPFSEFLCNLVWGYHGPIPGGFFFVFMIESLQGPPGPPKCPPGAIFAHFAKFLKNCSVTFSIILHEQAPGHNKYSCEICI